MMSSEKTVFFGPFIGEFGWELLFWQGWVRKVCKAEFRDHRKIVCSTPGREPFYPHVDEFWNVPDSFRRLKPSYHGYYTDGWRNGFPGVQVETYRLVPALRSLSRLRRPHPVWIESPIDSPDIEPQADDMLAEFRQRLPDDTLFFVPWKKNHYAPDNLEFGLFLPPGTVPTSGMELIRSIPFEHQLLEFLEPTARGTENFRRLVPHERKLILVFPRCRAIRRADKNWSRQNYAQLIRRLQERWPQHPVAICGEPGGAYFADTVPDRCIDLINVEPELRMDTQVAAMKQSAFALGSMSGAVLVTLAAGSPTLIWGFLSSQARYHRENFMGTPLIYHADIDPSVETVFHLAENLQLMLENWSRTPEPVTLR